MGEIYRYPIGFWRHKHGLRAFVETGTEYGGAVVTALHAGFSEVLTIEANPEQAKQAERVVARHQRRLSPSPRVRFVVGDSAALLPELMKTIPAPALWWLDAHLPGRYGVSGVTVLPLLGEVQAIVQSSRDHSSDIIVADDARLYGVPVARGPVPASIPSAPASELHLIRKLLLPTHRVRVDKQQEGYLVAIPRKFFGPVT
jgi:hypothetical protein